MEKDFTGWVSNFWLTFSCLKKIAKHLKKTVQKQLLYAYAMFCKLIKWKCWLKTEYVSIYIFYIELLRTCCNKQNSPFPVGIVHYFEKHLKTIANFFLVGLQVSLLE